MKPKHTEPQLHSSILENMKQFILELGKGDFLHIDDEFTVKVANKNKRIEWCSTIGAFNAWWLWNSSRWISSRSL